MESLTEPEAVAMRRTADSGGTDSESVEEALKQKRKKKLVVMVTDRFLDSLENTCDRTGKSKTCVIETGIVLCDLLVDASADGLDLGVVDKKGNLITRFVSVLLPAATEQGGSR